MSHNKILLSLGRQYAARYLIHICNFAAKTRPCFAQWWPIRSEVGWSLLSSAEFSCVVLSCSECAALRRGFAAFFHTRRRFLFYQVSPDTREIRAHTWRQGRLLCRALRRPHTGLRCLVALGQSGNRDDVVFSFFCSFCFFFFWNNSSGKPRVS